MPCPTNVQHRFLPTSRPLTREVHPTDFFARHVQPADQFFRQNAGSGFFSCTRIYKQNRIFHIDLHEYRFHTINNTMETPPMQYRRRRYLSYSLIQYCRLSCRSALQRSLQKQRFDQYKRSVFPLFVHCRKKKGTTSQMIPFYAHYSAAFVFPISTSLLAGYSFGSINPSEF